MGDELEDELNDWLTKEVRKKLKKDVSLIDFNCTEYYGWAGADYEERAMNHPYEAPWKKGTATYEDEQGNKIDVTWNGSGTFKIIKPARRSK